MLQVGFGIADITPPVGAEIPLGFPKPRQSVGVHDKLLAVACVVYDGTTPLALVGIDALFVGKETVDQARRLIRGVTKIPGDNVLIGASHTHSGGPLISVRTSKADPAYLEQVVKAITSAVSEAWHSLHAVELGIGTGTERSISFNRRFLMRNGREITHPGKPGTPHHGEIVCPAGPIDPDVGVLAARDPQGKIAGVVVNFACHGTVGPGEGGEFSPDWMGYLRKHLKTYYGAHLPVVFLAGASGDITQVDNMSTAQERGPEQADVMGMRLAAETIRTIDRMAWLKEAPTAAALETVVLSIRPEIDPALETPPFGLGSGAEDFWKVERQLLAEERRKTPKIPCEVQALRIGQLGIATNGAEYFCEYGLRIKKSSRLKPTWVVSLANEYIGYVCTAQAFMGGGYEPRSCTTSKMSIDAGQRLVETSLKALQKVKPREAEAK